MTAQNIRGKQDIGRAVARVAAQRNVRKVMRVGKRKMTGSRVARRARRKASYEAYRS
jgi:hypothetical protein